MYNKQTRQSDMQSCFPKGFTLIELLVVVLIIGILTAVALPQYKVAVMKSRLASILPLVASIKTAEEMYYLNNGQYTTNWNVLDVDVSQCKGRYADVIRCGDFWIDPFTNSDLNLGILYCPGTTSWMDCGHSVNAARNLEYRYFVWFANSAKPNQTECIGKTNVGKKVCATLR